MNKEILVPDIRFSSFIKDWENFKIGDLSKIVRGASPRPIQDSKWFDSKSDVGWLRIADVTEQDGRIYYLKQRISEAGQEKTRVLKTSHLLLSIAATVGKPVINYVNTGVHDGFLIFMNPSFDQEYMFQWLEMFRPKWKKFGQPGSQVNLNSELVRNQSIIIPNKEEQTKIGEFFKQLDNIITLQQQLLDDYKQLKKAMLQKMFPQKGESVPELRFDGFKENWKKINLGTLVEISSGINGNVTLNNGKYKLTRIETISNGKVNFNKVGFTNELPEKKYLLNKGDILYSNINSLAHIGKIAKFNLNYELYHGINLLRLSPKRILNSDFLYQYLSTVIAKQWAVAHANQAVNQASINQTELSKQLVHIPEYEEQAQIGNFFKQLDETIELHENKLKTYQELKKAMLQKMFI